jgi:hypothetical protein
MTDTNEFKNITLKTIKCKKILDKNEKKNKKRVESEKWDFDRCNYEYDNQLNIIKLIYENNYKSYDDISKIIIQQINKKIYGYKQQDIIKKLLDEKNFIMINSVINKMIECNLKCYYCSNEMLILYDISREKKQWSVDRIDNDKGHNFDNYHLACLECNLKRRRRSDDKFLFTKQLKILKTDNS